MALADTIAAWASAPGRSARAVIRLSGPLTRDAIASVTGCAQPDPGASPQARARYVRITLSRGLELPACLIEWRGPRSFTGEDSAELLIPGNPALVERVLHRLLSIPGVRQASPGEFSARAYLAGRLTLDQAEGIAHLIAAKSENERIAAQALLSGTLGDRYRVWADELATLLALVEAGIDFADQEDVVAIAPGELRSRLDVLRDAIDTLIGPGAVRLARVEDPLVVLVGPPNAGKSTLFNALLGKARSIASPVRGTTRDVIVEVLPIGLTQVRLADLPGLDAGAASPVGRAAQAAAGEAVREADILVVCDPAGRFNDLPEDRRPVIRVRTKADLPGGSQTLSGLAVCALSGAGLEALRDAIAGAVQDLSGASAHLAPRHVHILRAASDAIREASDLAATGADPALAAAAMRQALDELGDLTGRLSPDEIIGRIFSRFCIGK